MHKTNVMRILDQHKIKYYSYFYGDTSAISGVEVATVLNQDFSTPQNSALSERGVMILSDYLRYTMKKSGLDYAYTLSFLEDSYYENLSDDMYECSVDGVDLACYFKEYDCLAPALIFAHWKLHRLNIR